MGKGYFFLCTTLPGCSGTWFWSRSERFFWVQKTRILAQKSGLDDLKVIPPKQTLYLSLRSFILLVENNLSCGEILPHVKKFQTSPHDRCGEIRNSPHMACVWCRKHRHICKIYVIFCHNLRAFVWRKIEPQSTFVEKKWQISGLAGIWLIHSCLQLTITATMQWMRMCDSEQDDNLDSEQDDNLDSEQGAR